MNIIGNTIQQLRSELQLQRKLYFAMVIDINLSYCFIDSIAVFNLSIRINNSNFGYIFYSKIYILLTTRNYCVCFRISENLSCLFNSKGGRNMLVQKLVFIQTCVISFVIVSEKLYFLHQKINLLSLLRKREKKSLQYTEKYNVSQKLS